MVFKKITAVILLVMSLVGLGGIIYGLDYVGFLDIKPVLSKIPSMAKYLGEEKVLPQGQSPLEIENKELKEQVNILEKKIEDLLREKETLAQAKDQLEADFQEFQKVPPVEVREPQVNYEQLAQYYGQMKADAAVKIMENQEDEMVISILLKMSDDQVSKILTKMDPVRAANLVKAMTN